MSHMATNLDIDPELIEEAQRLGEHRTKKAAVTEALEEFIRSRKQLKIVELFNKIDYYPDYDPKKLRRKR
jgi:Bacterial antitoxin of type II TA system, VapB